MFLSLTKTWSSASVNGKLVDMNAWADCFLGLGSVCVYLQGSLQMLNGISSSSAKEKIINLETRTLSPYNLINWYSEARSTEAFGMCLEHIILTSGFTSVECYKVIAIINLNQNADVFVSFVFLSCLPMETPALSLPPRGIKMMLYYVELTHCCSLENPPACCA